MCGFSGILRWDGVPVDRDRLRSMTDTLRHRGPDDESYAVLEEGPFSVGLGFRRLSIIDLAGGRQPMAGPGGKTRLVFNGEIYNFRELRKDLEARGRRFQTRSDTEVILHLYEVYGADCVQRLRGMFAFAIWDGVKKQLFLARDRIGKKPLFYARAGKSLAFASEMKSLLVSGLVEKEVRLESLPLYFAYQFIPSPLTAFRQVERLPPAHTMTVDAEGRSRIERYWSLSYARKHRGGPREIQEELLHHLREATRIRLESDVPLGAFLSGGVDSSAVVGFMAEAMDRPVRTFSIGFEDDDFSELRYARLAAERFRTDHTEFVVKPEMTDVLPKLAWHYDQPFADPSALPSYYVARETRRHVTVALNGDGGDESFGGYLRYRADRIFASLARVPAPLRRLASGALQGASALWPSGRLAGRALKAAGLLGKDPFEFNFRLFCYFDQEAEERLFDGPLLAAARAGNVYDYYASLYARSDSGDLMDRILAADAAGYLPECLLVKMDIASMANSLEARSPLLDHKLMEFAATIPSRYKVKWGEGKWIFKQALRGFLPEPILARRKMGFGIPVARWFRGPLGGFLRDHLLSARARQRGFFRAERVRELVDQHQGGRKDHGYKLWALLMFELWCQAFLDKEGR